MFGCQRISDPVPRPTPSMYTIVRRRNRRRRSVMLCSAELQTITSADSIPLMLTYENWCKEVNGFKIHVYTQTSMYTRRRDPYIRTSCTRMTMTQRILPTHQNLIYPHSHSHHSTYAFTVTNASQNHVSHCIHQKQSIIKNICSSYVVVSRTSFQVTLVMSSRHLQPFRDPLMLCFLLGIVLRRNQVTGVCRMSRID